MSLDYSLTKCGEDVNTNDKVAAKFGEQALYSLCMTMMAVGVGELKTTAHCEKLYDRARALDLIPDNWQRRAEWWQFIQAMQGLTTNVHPGSTDAQFSKQLLEKMKRDGERERKGMVKEKSPQTA